MEPLHVVNKEQESVPIVQLSWAISVITLPPNVGFDNITLTGKTAVAWVIFNHANLGFKRSEGLEGQ